MGIERNTTSKGSLHFDSSYYNYLFACHTVEAMCESKFGRPMCFLEQARSGVEQSRREAVLLSKMNHPNIVAFKDSFEGLFELCFNVL